jgi:hypothetical protein
MFKSFAAVVFFLLASSLALVGQKNSSISTSGARAKSRKRRRNGTIASSAVISNAPEVSWQKTISS